MVVLMALFTAEFGVDASNFQKDVVRKSEKKVRRTSSRVELQNAIFGHLHPLEGHPQELEVRTALGKEGFSIPNFRRHLEDGDDVYGGYGFDISSFSLKLARCQTIKMYSDDAAQEGQSDVLVAKNFVVFRLCPSDYCNDDYNLGCKKNYNQYIMPLPDYLEFMQEFLENQKEAYCEYCEECFDDDERRKVRKVKRKLDEGNDDGAEENDDEENEDQDEENDDQAEDDEDGDDEEDDDENDDEEDDEEDDEDDEDDDEDDEDEDDADGDDGDDANQNDDAVAGDDVYDAACNVCDQDTYDEKCYEGDDDYKVDYEDWFECTQIDINNDDDSDNEYYAMAHCSGESDTSISVALFSDEYCTNLLGGSDIASNITGIAFDEYGMEDYYSGSCVTCNATELNADYEEEGQDDDGDGINDLCANVYEDSAQCNMQANDDDYNEESDVCLFIESVLSGTYDSSGDIYLSSGSNNGGNSIFSASQDQKIALGALVVLTFIMATWAIKLHMSIMTKVPWKPRHKNNDKLLDDDNYDRDGEKDGAMA